MSTTKILLKQWKQSCDAYTVYNINGCVQQNKDNINKLRFHLSIHGETNFEDKKKFEHDQKS